MKYFFLAFAFLLAVTALLLRYSFSPWTIYKNNIAVKKIEADDNKEANEIIIGELEKYPNLGELHFNLGLSFQRNKEDEKALQEYKAANRFSIHLDTRFRSHFNSGFIHQEKKQKDQTLEEYQAALIINPDSKEIKNNIEMLFLENSGQGDGNENNKDDQNKQKNDQDKNKDQNQNKNQNKNEDKKPDPKKEDKKENEKPNEQKEPQKPKDPKPKQFESKELSKKDVDRILEEFKRQENEIRGRVNHEKSKDRDPDKNW